VQKHTLGEVGTERLFDGKLRQEYLYQKLLKSDNWFSSYSRKCRRYFLLRHTVVYASRYVYVVPQKTVLQLRRSLTCWVYQHAQ